MCALLYYLCLTFSLLHFFLPPFFFFYAEFLIIWRAGDHSVSPGAFSWQASIFWPVQLWGEDCPSHFTFVTSRS